MSTHKSGILIASPSVSIPTHLQNYPCLFQVKRLPDDYMQNTLLPHLEHQLLYNIHVYGPGELARIARAYTTIPYKQKSLSKKLSEQVRLIVFGISRPHFHGRYAAVCRKMHQDIEVDIYYITCRPTQHRHRHGSCDAEQHLSSGPQQDHCGC